MILLTDFIKALHVTAGISLIAFLVFGLVVISQRQAVLIQHQQTLASIMPKIDRFGLLALGTAVLAGTLLVPMRHYSYQTPWIEAAYILLVVCGLLLRVCLFLKQKIIASADNPTGLKFLFVSLSIITMILLFFVIHDAVFKATFLFG